MASRLFSLFLLIIGGLLLSSCNLFNAKSKSNAPFPCEDGKAADYPCENVDLYSQLSVFELSGDSANVFVNDIWGWTDPQTGNEFALVGLTNGMAFVDISDAENPVVVARMPQSDLSSKYKPLPLSQFPACNVGIGTTVRSKSLTEGSTWRDVKVYRNHAFVVSDAQPHGMQVVDLTKLRNYEGTVLELQHDALYDKFGPSHNIIINEETGFAYASGILQAEKCGSRKATGLHIINIQNPKNPEYAGCYSDASPGHFRIAPGYIHDAQCVIYNGPDAKYQRKEICFNSAEGNVLIADVSDKENIKTIGYERQADMQYSHQGWLTENQAYFIMNDELDERNLGRGTKTYIWDVQDLENPVFTGYYEHDTYSIDHNLYIKGNYAYEANYNSGLQILDISAVQNANLKRVARFDTQPQNDAAEFTGTWSNYPFFESGLVVLSDIENGLFVVKPNLK